MLDRDCFACALQRIPHLSSKGPLSLVFEHLRDLLDPTDSASGPEALFRLVDHTARGGGATASCHVLLKTSTLCKISFYNFLTSKRSYNFNNISYFSSQPSINTVKST